MRPLHGTATAATYTIFVAGKPMTLDHMGLRELVNSRAGMAFDSERSTLKLYVQLGVLLLEVRRALGTLRSYTAFLRAADINQKKAGRAVRFASELGTELGDINRVRLFELLHAYNPERWPTIDSIDAEGGMPGVRAMEAALRPAATVATSAPELSTPARTHVSTDDDDSTGSWDDDEGDGGGVGDDELGDELEDGGGGAGADIEDVMAGAPVIEFDGPCGVDDDAKTETREPMRRERMTETGSIPSCALPAGIQPGHGPSSSSRRVGGESLGGPTPAVQLTLDSLYEQAERRVDDLLTRLRARQMSGEQCRRILELCDQLT